MQNLKNKTNKFRHGQQETGGFQEFGGKPMQGIKKYKFKLSNELKGQNMQHLEYSQKYNQLV